MFYKVKDQQCEAQLNAYTKIFIFTSSFFFAMQKKCITFVAVNNFYSNEDEDSKEENTTATLCEAAHSRYRSVNECYPPPPLTFVYFCKGAVAGDAIAAAVPLGRILAAHRTDSNRSTVRRFCLNGDTFVCHRGNANLRTSTDFTLLCCT